LNSAEMQTLRETSGLVWFGFTDELRVIEPRIQRANEC
jgi:hypothetical protein